MLMGGYMRFLRVGKVLEATAFGVVLLLFVIGLEVNPMLPLGGYFAALAGMAGPFVLAERFRTLGELGQLGGGSVGRQPLMQLGKSGVFRAAGLAGGEMFPALSCFLRGEQAFQVSGKGVAAVGAVHDAGV